MPSDLLDVTFGSPILRSQRGGILQSTFKHLSRIGSRAEPDCRVVVWTAQHEAITAQRRKRTQKGQIGTYGRCRVIWHFYFIGSTRESAQTVCSPEGILLWHVVKREAATNMHSHDCNPPAPTTSQQPRQREVSSQQTPACNPGKDIVTGVSFLPRTNVHDHWKCVLVVH